MVVDIPVNCCVRLLHLVPILLKPFIRRGQPMRDNVVLLERIFCFTDLRFERMCGIASKEQLSEFLQYQMLSGISSMRHVSTRGLGQSLNFSRASRKVKRACTTILFRVWNYPTWCGILRRSYRGQSQM